MKIRFKSEEAMKEFCDINCNEITNVTEHNKLFVEEYGMGVIQIDVVHDGRWWDITNPETGGCEFAIDVKLESKYFDIISE
ncbi:hypothetical protein ASwh1_385 [Aeromonas phage Aswh_1]|nr:hypothetical protein ASwh1_385 [Aeromonas phage Aswh_1]